VLLRGDGIFDALRRRAFAATIEEDAERPGSRPRAGARGRARGGDRQRFRKTGRSVDR